MKHYDVSLQAWLEELDGEGEGRRCVCGRTFERRAALAAHAHTCARRHRRRIGIQIRKDYHKEQANPYLCASGRGESLCGPPDRFRRSRITAPQFTHRVLPPFLRIHEY